MSEEAILDFSRQFDPQPMHADPEAAARDLGIDRQRLAYGGHRDGTGGHGQAPGRSPCWGWAWRDQEWPRPVRPGDTLRVEMEILEIRPSKSQAHATES